MVLTVVHVHTIVQFNWFKGFNLFWVVIFYFTSFESILQANFVFSIWKCFHLFLSESISKTIRAFQKLAMWGTLYVHSLWKTFFFAFSINFKIFLLLEWASCLSFIILFVPFLSSWVCVWVGGFLVKREREGKRCEHVLFYLFFGLLTTTNLLTTCSIY